MDKIEKYREKCGESLPPDLLCLFTLFSLWNFLTYSHIRSTHNQWGENFWQALCIYLDEWPKLVLSILLVAWFDYIDVRISILSSFLFIFLMWGINDVPIIWIKYKFRCCYGIRSIWINIISLVREIIWRKHAISGNIWKTQEIQSNAEKLGWSKLVQQKIPGRSEFVPINTSRFGDGPVRTRIG